MHCVNNIYSWTSTGTDSDGTLFTEFLAELNASELGGFDDWCIPNIKKLQSIVNYSTIGPASSVPGSTAASVYWSSTTVASGTLSAWGVLFNNGGVGADGKAQHQPRSRSTSMPVIGHLII